MCIVKSDFPLIAIVLFSKGKPPMFRCGNGKPSGNKLKRDTIANLSQFIRQLLWVNIVHYDEI